MAFSRQRLYKSLKLDKVRPLVRRHPLGSFFIALGILFLVIIIGNLLHRPKPQKPAPPFIRTVHTYNIGETPRASFQARIEKTGVIKIVALAPGVVQSIFVNEGDSVYKGTQILTLSSNYQGGNAAVIQAQIAQAQYKNALDTFDEQKNMVQKQRDIANTVHDNVSAMQKIASDSAGEVNALINANQSILDQMNQQLANGSTTVTQGAINQLQGAQDQLKQQIRNLNLQSDTTQPPARLADEQRDLTMQQLDIQEKSLTLNKEVSGLQAQLAAVGAAAMYPASPFAGTVERIYARVGQVVSPGTVLAEVAATDPKTTAVADVPEQIAKSIVTSGDSILTIDGEEYPVRPLFVPTEATNGSLFSIIFPVPDDINIQVTDGDYIKVSIPVGSLNTSSVVPFVPLDAIYQTQEQSYIMVAQNGRAETRQVTLGDVFGSFVAVTRGLRSGDQVILDRTVIAGDRVNVN